MDGETGGDVGLGGDPVAGVVQSMLEVARLHLGMDVAFISRFEGDRRVFRHVASGPRGTPIHVGDSDPLDASYCTQIVDGRLRTLTPDTRAVPALQAMPVTHDLDMGSYAGTPLVLRDGSTYGALCAFSSDAHQFEPGDARALELVASLIAHRLDEEQGEAAALHRLRGEVEAVLAGPHPIMHFQPVVQLAGRRVRGWEALARFDPAGPRLTHEWFAAANSVGVGIALERKAMARAFELLPEIPEAHFLSVNLSANALLDGSVLEMLESQPLHRIVVELTEQQLTLDRDGLADVVGHLRRRGARLAMDDVGAGFAGLERVLRLSPELIKLDIQLIAGVAHDHAKQAMVRAFAMFSRTVGGEVVAEGVETATDAETLHSLGVGLAQGHLFGRAAPRPWLDGA